MFLSICRRVKTRSKNQTKSIGVWRLVEGHQGVPRPHDDRGSFAGDRGRVGQVQSGRGSPGWKTTSKEKTVSSSHPYDSPGKYSTNFHSIISLLLFALIWVSSIFPDSFWLFLPHWFSSHVWSLMFRVVCLDFLYWSHGTYFKTDLTAT